MADIRDVIFATIQNKEFTAHLTTERGGVLSGVSRLKAALAERSIKNNFLKADGNTVEAGESIAGISGGPKDIAVAEEFIVGMLSKPSGIASAARQAVIRARGMRVVSGAWKKMPPEIKHSVREAVSHGGAHFRIVDVPFLYLDKNFVRMFGGIRETLLAVKDMAELKVIQVKGDSGDIAAEALAAANYGAGVIMVDTGNIHDLRKVSEALTKDGLRSRVRLAFAKGITLDSIEKLQGEDIEILDIGAEIIDGPLLDMKFDVIRG